MATKVAYDAKTKLVTVTFPYDTEKAYAASASGKTDIIDTSHGFVSIPGTVGKVSVTATAPLGTNK